MKLSARLRTRGTALLALTSLVAVAACEVPTAEERAKAAEEIAKRSLQSIDHGAMSQKVDPEVVKKVQEQLTVLNQYMGPINGKLDQVTINAYEAFERNNDLQPDGMFDDDTLRLLEAAARARSTTAAAG